MQKIVGFAPCLFHGCSFFSAETWGIVPYCKPITTVGEFKVLMLEGYRHPRLLSNRRALPHNALCVEKRFK
jgi:hypothetical protein